MSQHPLEPVFCPRSLAVVGASSAATPGTGGGFLSVILQAGFKGPVYPVNPRHGEVQGLRCYPSLRDVPGDVDYVISSIPASAVEALVEDCAAKNVRALHFFTAGFSETGDEERGRLEQQVVARARELGIRVIGPNCMGLYVPAEGLAFMAGFPREPGSVAFVSQSGANASEFVGSGAARGLRYSKVISYGNGADLNEADFLDYLASDDETAVIGAYIEGVRDGRRFLATLRKAASRKPVAVLKGGRTRSGSRATRSHTASLAGEMRVFEAVCRQAGAVLVDSMDGLVDMMVAFSSVQRLAGPRAAIIIGGGGRSVLSADEVDSEGLEVPPLPEAVQSALREFMPLAGTSVLNPIDAALGTPPELFLRMLTTVASSPNVDFVLHGGGGLPARPGETDAAGLQEAVRSHVDSLLEVQRREGKPVVLISGQPSSPAAFAASQALQATAGAAGITVFPSMRRAARALASLLASQRMQEEQP